MANGNGELPPEYILQGRYKILHKVADGGMGVVYKAVDTYLSDRPIAVKEMKQPSAASKGRIDLLEAVRLFKQEAAILSGLNHPNLPHVYGTIQDAGNYYLVMDFIEGDTLLQKIKSSWSQPLKMADVLDYAIQLCDILDYLHSQRPQIIFRDLKPANIIIDTSGRVFLIDFGIARHFKPHQSGDTIVIGTPGYLDPEISQLKQTNPRSDLYSLGATLHHCLTGQSPNYVSSHFRFPSVCDYNRSVPIEFDRLIRRLVEPRSTNRPTGARQVKQQLLQIQQTITGAAATGTVAVDHDAPTVAGNSPTVSAGASPFQLLAAVLKSFSGSIGSGFSVLAAPVFAPLGASAKSLVDLFWKVLPPGSWSSYSPVWRPRFLILLGTLLALMIGTGIYLLQVFANSYYAVDLCLSLLLLFIVFILRNTISEHVPRSILTATIVPVLVFTLALLLQPIVSSPAHPSSAPLTVSHILTWVLLTLALLALLGGFITSLLQAYVQQARWRVWADRLALFALTGTWTFLQFFSGNTEHLPFDGNAVYLLATRISFEVSPQSTLTVTINQLLCIPLALITVILLLRSKNKITAGDRRLLFLAAIPYVLLQWNYGPAEMLHFFPSSGLATATAINVALFLLLIVAVFVMLRPELDRLDLLDRVALLLLMLSSASLQSFLTGNGGGNVRLPLLSTQLPAVTFSTLLTFVLLASGLLLLLRAGRALNVLDRALWAAVSLSCAAIEFAYGQQQAQRLGQTSLNANPGAANAIALADLHQTLGLLLVCLVVAGILLAIIQGLLPASQRNTATERPLRWVDRFTMLALVLASSLLLFAFNWGQLLPYINHPGLPGQATSINTPFVVTVSSFALAILLLLVDIAALFRFFKPLGKGDRWIFLVCNLTCILLLLGNTTVQHLPLLISRTNHLTGGWSQVLTMSTLASAGLIITALISLRWLARPFEPFDRLILSVVFLAAVAFALLQVSHTQFFLALLALILGVLIAAQIERVRTGTRFT